MNCKPNGQEEARQIRRTQGQSEHLSDSDIYKVPGSEGLSNGFESIRIDRNNSSTRDRSIGRGERVTGGMLRQLISEYRSQMAIKQQEITNIETRLKELETLQQELEEVEPQ